MKNHCKNGLHDLSLPGAARVGSRNGHQCIECYRAVHRKAVKKVRRAVAEFLDAVKLQRGCASCGYREHVAALQFDHIVPRHVCAPNKKDWAGAKYMKQAQELASDPNVQVLCANCHCIKTRQNGDYKKG